MTDQAQAAPAQEQVQIRIGFEAALDNFNAEWRTAWGQEQIDACRYFYHAGVRDTSVFVNNAIANMSEGYKWINDALLVPQSQAKLDAEKAAAEAAAVADPKVVTDVVDTSANDAGAGVQTAADAAAQAPVEAAPAPVTAVPTNDAPAETVAAAPAETPTPAPAAVVQTAPNPAPSAA